MPTPKKNETRDDFIDRCIPIVIDEGTAKDGKQAYAVCRSMYDDKKEKKMSNATLNADVKCFAQTEGAPDKEFDFELVGYTGKIMSQAGHNFIFDLDGIQAKEGGVIVLREHERDRIVGHGKVSKDERGLIVRGKFSSATPDGIEVKAILEEGIVPLQCSVGIAPVKARAGKDGDLVNGVTINNRVDVWEESYVGEVSICSWGVDTDTSVRSFAKEIEMSDIKELCEKCHDEECKCEDTPVEETPVEETPVEEEAKVEEETTEEPTEEAPVEEKKFSQADIDAAIAGERSRVAAIFAADAPVELAKEAIEKGFSEGEAFKFFWMSEKGMKEDGLKVLAAEAPELPAAEHTEEAPVEMSYLDLIKEFKAERGLNHLDATKAVMKEHPEAYSKFMGR